MAPASVKNGATKVSGVHSSGICNKTEAHGGYAGWMCPLSTQALFSAIGLAER